MSQEHFAAALDSRTASTSTTTNCLQATPPQQTHLLKTDCAHAQPIPSLNQHCKCFQSAPIPGPIVKNAKHLNCSIACVLLLGLKGHLKILVMKPEQIRLTIGECEHLGALDNLSLHDP
eukprot:6141000-Amphidinium_carterae.1